MSRRIPQCRRMFHPLTVMLLLVVVVCCATAATAASFGAPSATPLRLGYCLFGGATKVPTMGEKVLGSAGSEPCLARRVLASAPRGGAMDDGSDEEEDEELDDDDDNDDDAMFDFEEGVAESDFAEDTTIDRLIAAWKKTPPLTKGYLSASAAATLYGYLFTKNEFPKVLMLDWRKVLTRLQLWRPFTSFLNFGPLGLGYIMTAQFVWVYMSTLERLNHNRPYDFWIMILFGQLSMVIGYPVLNLSPRFLGHNLSTFLVYIWSRYHEGIEVNMFELFNTRAEMLPWFFLAQTFLLEGEPPVLDFLGIVFGHIYHHCKTVGILRAPESLTKWYEESASAERIRELYKPISSDFDAQ